MDDMIMWIISGVFVLVFVGMCIWDNRCSLAADDGYGNRLDQLKEDARIEGFIDEEALRMYSKYLVRSSWAFVWDAEVPVYHVFDEYVAKWKGVDINWEIHRRFEELIKEK